AYMSVKELKEALHLSGTDNLNVFFASNSVREELAGAATWPWAKESLTHQGGMVLSPSYFGTMGHQNTMIHEMGHILGLYHVFKGVSERDSCDDPCQETTPSMETGDLCADTAPTPKSKACHDPGTVNDSCGVTMYHNTPYSNYMSYTDDNCTNHFTPNQVARMHCYLDLLYQKWLMDQQPSPTPLAPIVTDQSPDSVSIYWLPPLRGMLYQSSSFHVSGINCGDCEKDGALHQYASEATSPRICDTSGYWTPEEAVGPPDVEQPCDPSLQAWSPELSLYDTNVTSPCPDTEGCTLTLRFLHPIVPHALTLWVTYISSNNPAIANIELITDTGKSINLGPQHVFCDMPLTLRLDTNNAAVATIKLCTFDEKMEIDAAMLSSGPGSPLCGGCQPLVYRIQRQPPFASKSPPPQTQQTFTDSSVRQGVRYDYTIQVEAEGLLSDPSPSLLYTHGQSYCGDGLIQGTEDCDDTNLLDGDGCSKKCHKEIGFNCHGEPSQCYVFDGDGVCEEFERGSSVQDCGYFTPLGYTDQWASTATASHQNPDHCSANAATGEPSLTKLCRYQHLEVSERIPTDAWFPCVAQSDTNNDLEHPFWLKVGFLHSGVAASVMVYLASDGSWSGEQCRRTATILLSDTTGKNHSLGTHDLSCHRNPLVVNVTHDLSRPFFITASVILLFSSPFVAVGGVALRTSCHFSTFALTGCTGGGESSHCSVQCRRGFSISVHNSRGTVSHQRDAHLECFHGSWDRVVSCQPVDCALPDQSHVYHAIFSCPWGTTFGKQCSFTCGSPAILQGDSDRLVCLEDSLWSFPEAYCKIECAEVPDIPDAKLLTADCLASGHDVGTVCRYKCNTGFYVMGSINKKTQRKFLKMECLEGGQWETSTCEPISCAALPDVFQGMYSCTNGLNYDSLCTLRCPDTTENREIRCSKDGEWTAEFTMCSTLQGSCSPPPDLNSVEYSCDQGMDVGAVCYPTCIVALDMDLRDPVVLPNDNTVESLKHWMLPTTVQVGFLHSGVAASVMVYLASDGSWSGEQCRRTATILLSDTTGKNHSLGTHDLSCHRNPLVVNVTHDLSRPFFITASVILLFSSPFVAVGGVALRTSCHFSTFALTGCTGGGESSHCSVQCRRGFSISVHNSRGTVSHQRDAHLECFHGSWDRVVSCQPVDCALPDQSHVYHAIFSCPWGTTFGKQCSFTCGSPAILQGDSDRLVCLEDSLWSFPEAYCKIECAEVPDIPDAKLLTADCLASGHDVGTVCRYKCNTGFYVMGSINKKTQRKFLKMECLEGGQWETSTCEPISCAALPDVFQGMYSCTNGLNYDSLCTLRCPDTTENREIRCSKDGEWTAEFTMCSTLQGSCSPPPDLNSVEYSCDQGMDVGAVCYPTCIVALDMDLRDPVVLPNDNTVESLKHWMLPTTVQSIVCTGMMKWHPDPQHIHCIQSCEPFGGDGWCDTINNRAYCQYDGGDCCPSTLSTRK
ncbi:hypothetical protein KUCAC02_018838, partial [Chaenocephalus aceratus]